MRDPVREFLRIKGSAEHVVKGGLEGLVENWETTVRSLEKGYALTLDDYRNDLDVRQLIAEAWPLANDDQRAAIAPRLDRADVTFRRLTQPTRVSVWGDSVAAEAGWTAQDNWWYFARPSKGDLEFLSEIDEAIGRPE